MENTSFMRVEEVAQELGISKSYACKIVQRLNAELEEKGILTISGRVNRKYFMKRPCGFGAAQRRFRLCCKCWQTKKTTWNTALHCTACSGIPTAPKKSVFPKTFSAGTASGPASPIWPRGMTGQKPEPFNSSLTGLQPLLFSNWIDIFLPFYYDKGKKFREGLP